MIKDKDWQETKIKSQCTTIFYLVFHTQRRRWNNVNIDGCDVEMILSSSCKEN